MASKCISSCVNDARAPIRATYVNLYKWPESDAEFVKSMSRRRQGAANTTYGHPRVVDSYSCRQLYLRSYTFSREGDDDDHDQKCTVKCLGDKAKKKDFDRRKSGGGGADLRGSRRKKAGVLSCSALKSILRRLLACTTEINVVK